MRHKRLALLGVGLVIALGSGVAVWQYRLAQSEPGEPIWHSLSRATRNEHVAREKHWSQAPLIAASSKSSEIASAWRGTVRDVDGLVTEEQKEALLESAARFVNAYSSETPDGYIALVESTPWLGWRAGADELLGMTSEGAVYDYFFGHRPDDEMAGDAIALLGELWPKLMVERGWGFDSVGSGESGALFAVQKTYSAEQSFNGLEGVKGDTFDYWEGAPMISNAMDVTAAPTEYGGGKKARAVLPTLLGRQERSFLPVAYGHVLVKAANGVMFNWQTRWVLDPKTKEWICDHMAVRTGRPINVFF